MAIAMRRGGAFASPEGDPAVDQSTLRGPGGRRLDTGGPALGSWVTTAPTVVPGDLVGTGSSDDVAALAQERPV